MVPMEKTKGIQRKVGVRGRMEKEPPLEEKIGCNTLRWGDYRRCGVSFSSDSGGSRRSDRSSGEK